MRAKHLKRNIKRQWFTGALCLTTIILLLLSATLGIQLIWAMRRNQFSKNIILSNNYFLGTEKTENNRYWLDDVMAQCTESPAGEYTYDLPAPCCGAGIRSGVLFGKNSTPDLFYIRE
jgi:hypothetical protein